MQLSVIRSKLKFNIFSDLRTFLGSMLELNVFFGYYIYRAYSIFVNLFFSGINNCQPLILFLSFFEHIFEHINCPLSGLIFIADKCRSEDQQGVLLLSARKRWMLEAPPLKSSDLLYRVYVRNYFRHRIVELFFIRHIPLSTLIFHLQQYKNRSSRPSVRPIFYH